MNIMALNPGLNKLKYAFRSGEDNNNMITGIIDKYSEIRSSASDIIEILSVIQENYIVQCGSFEPDVIALRVKFGGDIFKQPVIANEYVIEELKKLTLLAPLHIPQLIILIESCMELFDGVPVVLLFDTAFSLQLPERERVYGIEQSLSKSLGIRKYSYKGIYHQAACKYVERERHKKGITEQSKTISICLESKPEIAAVNGTSPKMMTGGNTPLEGLPGHTTSGEIDPAIVLMLSQKLTWGPEKINRILTEESGIYGLTGNKLTFSDIFNSEDSKYEEVRDIVKYRLLLSCGSAIAAMGGLDTIVFSGVYSDIGNIIGPWLAEKLTYNKKHKVKFEIFSEPIEKIMIDEAGGFILNSMVLV